MCQISRWFAVSKTPINGFGFNRAEDLPVFKSLTPEPCVGGRWGNHLSGTKSNWLSESPNLLINGSHQNAESDLIPWHVKIMLTFNDVISECHF